MTLAKPLELPCGAVLPNRVAKAAMSEQLATLTGRPTAAHVRLYDAWARSGCGLVITGNVIVDRRAVSEPRQVVVEDDRDTSTLRAWAAAARSGGAHCWVQLNHAGRQIPRTLSGRPVAPSAQEMTSLRGGFAPPRALTASEIEELVQRFARSAQIAVAAGFDGVQIHAAHGYLISQFLSPLTNRRTDAWGGDALRRRRFLLAVIDAVRGAVGPKVPVAVKLNSSDFQRGGFDEDDSMAVVDSLGDAGIDLLEISGGTFESTAMMTGAAESTRAREAYFLDYAERVRARARMPLMLTGGLRSAVAMRAAVDSGAIDVCGVARPLVLEPDIAQRLLVSDETVSAAVPRRGRISRLAGAAETIWYTEQIHRISRGRTAKSGRSVEAAMARYLLASTRDALVRRVVVR
ncbi:NADH:flavin oxidoreductase/NADH oxidase family protein [Mycolicibacterium pulveris]|uniref:NADH:flavin oxidoreductase/NADH oxidase family protein n=1 Tax=Mycolicibacterium pulveris TaxID=36813 RepID=UPI003CF47C11